MSDAVKHGLRAGPPVANDQQDAGSEQSPSIRIDVTKDYLHFSIAHFTIFSRTERENLHGHNFQVTCQVETRIGEDGLCFDYGILKSHIERLCNELDEHVILPLHSPHLSVASEGSMIYALFADERIPFLARDVKCLPIANATIEAFAAYFVGRLQEDLADLPFDSIAIGVSSGPGQWATCRWERT